MSDLILMLSIAICFIGGVAFSRRIWKFILIAYFDDRVTVRYFAKDGSVSSKRIVVSSDNDISLAIDELKAQYESADPH